MLKQLRKKQQQHARWHSVQPHDGDVVLMCEHRAPKVHWFKYANGPVHFKRPNGTTGIAHWLVCCTGCYMANIEHPEKIRVAGDGTWNGDAPVIAAHS